MTQQNKILLLLKQAGTKGINSYGVGRQIALQLPRVMNDLKKAGHLWTTRRHRDASVDYILLSSPRTLKEGIETPDAYIWQFDDGTARRVLKSSLKPKQLSL